MACARCRITPFVAALFVHQLVITSKARHPNCSSQSRNTTRSPASNIVPVLLQHLVPYKAQPGPLLQFPLPVGTFGKLATSICALACWLPCAHLQVPTQPASVTTRVPGCDKGCTMAAYSFSFPCLLYSTVIFDSLL
ncbi:hypothetical protein ACQKWADRAFT_302603 [Trichoderma austrokoningii]